MDGETPVLPMIPEIHFVSGFLGSGKTTAIVNACRVLLERGISPAIVTNDQGSRQVDGAFARIARIPSVGVSNGCLCCRYDDFEQRVLELAASERPKVIFAESVGSCADIVATVVRPFAAFRATHRPRGLLSTFVDVRMLERRLAERADGVRRLPFSDNVLYIFDKQLEEADIIVINKRDLIDPARAMAVRDATQALFQNTPVVLHEGRDVRAADGWLKLLGEERPADATGLHPSERPALDLDYDRYAAGEIEMAWLDEEFIIDARRGGTGGRSISLNAVSGLFWALARALEQDGLPVTHLKFAWETGSDGGKLSLTAGETVSRDKAQVDDVEMQRLVEAPVTVTVNIRAVAAPEQLAEAMDRALDEQQQLTDTLVLSSQGRDTFRPGYPRPVHRLSEES